MQPRSRYGHDFQEEEFRIFLRKLKSRFDSHYLVSEIPQILSQIHRSKFILRHDVRSNLDTVLKMAEVEHAMGIRATFLFDLSSSDISPENHTVRNSIQAVRDLGHEVGLHLPDSNPETHRDAFLLSRKLGKYLSAPILSISFSENHHALPPGSFFISGKISASSRIMMGWHISDKTSSLERLNPRPSEKRPMLQVIIHPENWIK
jgi:hypothetical protein